jgi:hypothetical protein
MFRDEQNLRPTIERTIMITCLSISKNAPGHYSMHVDGADSGAIYSSIAEAITDHSDIPPQYAMFVNIEYCDICLATMSVADMQSRTSELARELVQMSAEIHATT